MERLNKTFHCDFWPPLLQIVEKRILALVLPFLSEICNTQSQDIFKVKLKGSEVKPTVSDRIKDVASAALIFCINYFFTVFHSAA